MPDQTSVLPPKVDYPSLPPRQFGTVSSAQYIEERLNGAIKWYDKKADESKKLYLRMRAATVIAGALVPVLININNVPYMNVLTTIISLIVVLLVSLESVYHYREQWTNYRSTEQYLRNEYFLFTSKGGAYGSLASKLAYRHFVERVEEIIGAENSSTLKIMTSLVETKPEGGKWATPSGTDTDDATEPKTN